MTDLENARHILKAGNYTCVLCKDTHVLTSLERGVKPLVAWLEANVAQDGYSAADKVVGKGAAFLYVKLGVRAVFAGVISTAALLLLQRHGIPVEYDREVDYIVNRKGDGRCPFELAVADIDEVELAYLAIRAKMREMHL